MIDNARWDDEDELAETYSRRKGFAYGRSGRPVQQRGVAEERAVAGGAGLPEPGLGGTGRHHHRHLLRHAGRHQPRRQARQVRTARRAGPGGAGVHRRPDQRRHRRRHRAHAGRAGVAGNPHPHAQPEVVRRHAGTRLRGRAPDRGAPDQHHGLVGHHRAGAALGLPAADRDLRARPGDARAPGRTQSHRIGPRGQPLLEAHRRQYWQPDDKTLEALQRAGEELEDRLEGVYEKAAA
jgi:magnesium chelatase subunit H